ncbi:MAG: outer membrane protein assembly factor BamA [Deltaproteobacteria bacterium]|nr:outer membrane protein assembly factor BamA [Deltaproteobacteria bacterium]
MNRQQRSVSPACPSFSAISRLSLLLLHLVLCAVVVTPAVAAEQNTTFLPAKINGSGDTAALTSQADKALAAALTNQGFTMVERDKAKQMLNYNGAWPPALKDLHDLAQKTGQDYVAIGSVTAIGDQVSVDYKVYDLLAASTPQSYYRHGESLKNLDSVMEEISKDILRFTNRGQIITSLAAEGNKRIDSGAIIHKIQTKTGDIYSPTVLRKDLKAIFAMGYFDNVNIKVEESTEGKKIIFQVTEKPLISKVEFAGISALDEKDVKEAANVNANTIVNPATINKSGEAIKTLYKSKGYYDTKVTPKISYPDKDQAVVRYTIEEGPKIYIKEINFVGNKSFDSKKLADVIKTSTKGLLSWITDSGLLKNEQLNQDSASIGSFYNNQGFLEVKVSDPVVKQEGEWLYITFNIEEGPRYMVGTIDIKGDLITDKQELRNLLTVQNEKFINRKALRDDILKITDYYAEHGYAFADVRPNIDKSKGGGRVDISIEIKKGELVYIDRITISGNTRTRDNVIRREIEAQEGGVFDSKALRASSEALQRLEFFEEVNIHPEPSLDPAKMNILVDVKEKNTGQFSIGMGYSSVDSLMFMAEVAENNFMGTGDKVSLSGNVSGKSTQFNLSFTDPHLRDSKLSWGADLYDMSRIYDDYTRKSTGGALRLGYPIFEKWKAFGAYSYENTTLSDLSIFALANPLITQSLDLNVTSAVKFALVRDTRDRPSSPSTGSQNQISVKYAGGPFAGDSQFTKLEASSSWFFPLPWTTVFHVKGSAGEVWENETNKLPVYERFYLGGMNSIRGFQYGKVSPMDINGVRIGGDKMWFGNFEYIFPLMKEAGLNGVIFFDVGKNMADDMDWSVSDYNKATGLELRWISPMGPLRLVWGYNLDPKAGEDQSVWDFSIGGGF